MPLLATRRRDPVADAQAGAKAFVTALIAQAPNASPRNRAIAVRFTMVYDDCRGVLQLRPAEAFAIAADAIAPLITQDAGAGAETA